MQTLSEDAPTESGRRLRAGLIWGAFLVAFLPVLLDYLRHVAADPWATYALLFPPLFAWSVLHETEHPRPARDGWLWLGLGVLLDLIALAGGAPRIGRTGLLLAAIGLCRIFAFAPWRTALLRVWAIPVPRYLISLWSPQLESALLAIAGGIVNALGGTVEINKMRAMHGELRFYVADYDAGLALAVFLAGLGWYAGVRAGVGLVGCAVRSVGAAILAAPIQLLGVTLATAAVAAGSPPAARVILDYGVWIPVALAAIAAVELRARRVGR